MSDRPSVIQLAGADFPSVLCDDGSVYRWTGAEWEIITDQEALRMQRQHASFWKRWSNFFNRDDGVNHECP